MVSDDNLLYHDIVTDLKKQLKTATLLKKV